MKLPPLSRDCIKLYIEYKMFCKVVYQGLADKRDSIQTMSFKQLQKYSHELMNSISKSSICSSNRLKFRHECVPEEARDRNHAFEIERANEYTSLGKDILRDVNTELHKRIEELEKKKSKSFTVLNTEESIVSSQVQTRNDEAQTLPQTRNRQVQTVVQNNSDTVFNDMKNSDKQYYLQMVEIFMEGFDKSIQNTLNEEQKTKLIMVMVEAYINDTLMLDMNLDLSKQNRSLQSLAEYLEERKDAFTLSYFTIIKKSVSVFKSIASMTKFINMGKDSSYIMKLVTLYYFLEMKLTDDILMLFNNPNEIFRRYDPDFITNSTHMINAYMFMLDMTKDFNNQKDTFTLDHINEVPRALQRTRSIFKRYYTPQTPQRTIDLCIYVCFKLGAKTFFEDPLSLPSTLNVRSYKMFLHKKMILPFSPYIARFINNYTLFITKEPDKSLFTDVFTFR
jgi:hypothetical protein